jgi:hypothetical protein
MECRVPIEAPGFMAVTWEGPYLLVPDHQQSVWHADAAGRHGLYLVTVEHEQGYLIYFAGLTTRPFRRRFREHVRAYRSGVYTVFDAQAFQRGQRVKIWPGFWFGKRPEALVKEYANRCAEIQAAVEELLRAYRVFFAPLEVPARTLERVEAALMMVLYSGEGTAAQLPDKGMHLAPRWPAEPPLVVSMTAPVKLHGVPASLEA